MNLLQRARHGRRSITTIEDYLGAVENYFTWGNNTYGPGVVQSLGKQTVERIGTDFAGLATHAFGKNSIIFACMLVRQLVFSGVRFQYQRFNTGRPSELFGDASLRLLEEPWDGGTTGDLLSRMMVDADLAGNSYWTAHGGELVRLRPDWVDIVLEPRIVPVLTEDGVRQGVLGHRKLGYLYYEGGSRTETDPVPLAASEVAHFAPIEDPLANYRGMSWITPLVREIAADDLMTGHKRKFFENGATPNMIVKHAPHVTPAQAKTFKAALDEEYAGAGNAYKTMHVGAGADVTVVGTNFQQLEFKAVQGHGETRITAAAGLPSIIVGLSEGLESATYSNYGQARRRLADGTMHPLWANAAGSLQRVRSAPAGARLWYDTRDVPFLREDSKDAAEIAQMQAATMADLVQAGYTPESVQRAVLSGDFGLLAHSGLYSVQLWQPGANQPAATDPDPSLNGSRREIIRVPTR